MTSILKLETTDWHSKFEESLKKDVIEALEDGKVIFFPNLKFEIKENELPLFNQLNLKVKSLKYNLKEDRLWGAKEIQFENEAREMIKRYALSAVSLVENLFPHYKENMQIFNSSFRPIEAEGRKQSKRHDDTRLHVDSFPSRPVQGKRLLRVFANVNLEGSPRVWNVGEEFETVAEKFLPKISPPSSVIAKLLKFFKLTKTLRTPYDHYMLSLHDSMKLDETYQANAEKENIHFPAGSVWICFSDKVSHAVLSGKSLLEQTILLKPEEMQNPEKSPLKILERLLNKKLV